MHSATKLDTVPLEILLKIYSHLSPETTLTTAAVCKNFKIAAYDNLFWKEKFKLHFPHVFGMLSNQKNVNWYAEFSKIYKDEYKGLSKEIRKLFSLVKEGDLEALKAIHLKLDLLDKTDKNHVSLLEWAKKTKNQKILDYFFERAIEEYSKMDQGIDPTKQDAEGRTILHWAILCNQSKSIISKLIWQGCDINKPSYNILRSIHLACREGRLDIVELLLKREPSLLDQRDGVGQTPIIWAAYNGHADIVRYLAKRGADSTRIINHGKYYDYTVLHWATEMGNIETVKALVDNNAQLDIPINDGTQIQALHIACREGHLDIVKLLLQKQPSLINQMDNMGQTPILWAASRGHADIVLYLAEQGADLTQSTNIDSYRGYTALHWATENGYTETVKALIDHNAPLDGAVDYGDLQALHIACREGHLDIVKLLLQKQPSLINQLDNAGQTPILWAAFRGHDDIVRYLAEQGADLTQSTNVEPYRGYTALHWAAEKGHINTVQALLDNNANTNMVTEKGDTPLHIAAKLKHVAIARILIKKKANICATNNRDKKPIDVAPRGNIKLQMKLLSYSRTLKSKPDMTTSKKSFALFSKSTSKSEVEERLLMFPATKALKKVLFDGANPSCLNGYKAVLEHSEFEPLYRGVKK